jgi:hypothetical protein
MDDRVRGSGNGKRMRRRCMRFEVVLHAYRHLRWDVDAIRRVGHTFASDSTTISLLKTASFSQPAHRPPTTLSPVPSPDSFRLTFPRNSHIHPSQLFICFVLTPLPPCLSHLQILFHVCGLKLCRQRHRCRTTNLRFILRGSIFAKQLSSRSPLPSTNGSPSTSPFTESEYPISASLLQPSRIQRNGSPCHLHPKIHFTKLTTGRANLTRSDTKEISKALTPLFTPLHPHAPNQCSSLATQSPIPNNSLTSSLTSPLSPRCQATKQKKLRPELPHPNARDLPLLPSSTLPLLVK